MKAWHAVHAKETAPGVIQLLVGLDVAPSQRKAQTD